jgi:hypothetical protein
MKKQVGEMDRVVFRVDPEYKDVVAFLPDEPVNQPYISSYAHVGQHSEASWDYYYNTQPATPDQYLGLMQELKSLGYRVKPYVKMPHWQSLKTYAYNTKMEA